MPLTVNVGLSRKSSHNYNSTGVSLNLTAEMDQALLAHPGRLQKEIAALYEHVEAAVARQEGSPPSAPSRRNGAAHAPGRGASVVVASNGAGNGRSDRPGDAGPAATASQIRALRAICRRLDIDLDQAAEDELGVPADQLGVRQASQLIDALKLRDAAPSRQRGS